MAVSKPRSVTIQNATPAFTVGPSDGGSDTTAPTSVGSNVTFAATATDNNGDQYYVAICKTNAVVAGNDAAPTCTGGSWAISVATASGVAITPITYTVLVTDTLSTYAWYGFVCDKVAGGGACSSASQGTGTTGSPFAVNHAPSFSAGPSDGSSSTTTPTNVGSNVSFTATATDPDGNAYYLAVCKTSAITAGNNAAPTCASVPNTWAISAATASGVAITPITYTTLIGDASSNAWYAFVCDQLSSGIGACSAVNQGTGDSGSPFVVNHAPTQSTPSSRTHALLDANSVGYWQLEDGSGATAFDDQTANSNNGSCTNCPTWTQEGVVGGGTSFDGTNDTINVTDAASLDSSSTMTLEVWVKHSGAWPTNEGIIGKRIASSEYMQYSLGASSSTLYWLQSSSGATWETVVSTSLPSGDAWHHIVGTNNGTVARLYIDGAEVGTADTSPATSLAASTQPLMIGQSRISAADDYFSGLIDEVHIYNRALSAAEIKNHYNSETYVYKNNNLSDLSRPHASLVASSVAYLQLEDGISATSFDDQTANSNNGSCAGGACPTFSAEGAIGGSYQFDGSEDYINLADSTSLRITNAISVSAWIYPTSLSGNAMIIAKWNDSSNKNFYLYRTTNQACFDISNGSSNSGICGGTLSLNTWHHLVGTYDGSTTKRIYLDGNQVNSGTESETMLGSAVPVTIGRMLFPGFPDYFTGSIDEPHIYNGTLSADDIRSLYTFGSHDLGVGARTLVDLDGDALVCSVDWRKNGTSAAVLNMSFNKNVTTTTAGAVPDYSSYANNGTLSGGFTWSSSGANGGAYSFNGTTGYISIPDSSSLRLTTKGTVEFWFNRASLNNVSLGKFAAGSGNEAYELQLFSDNKVYFSASGDGLNNNYFVSTSTYANTGWNHLVGTYDGVASTMKVYLNGSEIAGSIVGSVPASIFASTAPVENRYYNGSAWIYSNGMMDEVHIYNIALSSAQISAMYNAAKPNYQNLNNAETTIGDLWTANMTFADSFGFEGSASTSNSVEILGFTADVSDGGSYSGVPTSVGSNVTFTGTFNAPSSRQWYLAVCKSNAVTAGNNAAPTCDGGSWAISSEIADGASSSTATSPAEYTALITDAESNAWYAFACDKVASVATCSPMTQGSGDSGSPFAVNHRPSYSGYAATDSTGGSIEPGENVKFAVTTADTDTSGTQDTVAVFVCASGNTFNGSACSGTQLCTVAATAPGAVSCTTSTSPAPIPWPHGSTNVEVFVVDSHSLVGSGASTQTFSVTDVAPTISSSGQYSVSAITLVAGDSTAKSYTVTVTDNNGDNDITGATGVLYDSAFVNTAFGSGTGKVTTAIGSGADNAYSVAIQSDGKIVEVGSSHNGTNKDFAVARYSAAGVLDSSFGTGGKVTSAIGSGDDIAMSVALQPDGKIVAAGGTFGSNWDLALARYTTAGVLDSSFGTGGIVTTAVGSSTDYANSVAIQSDGKIVVVGYSYNGANLDFVLARYTTAGVLDSTFGTGGKVTTPIGTSNDEAYSIAIQSDGKIVAGGGVYSGTDYSFALARYTTAGVLDTTFDSDGIATTTIGGVLEKIYAISIQSDGKIVAGGYSNNGSNDDFALARFTTTGALDTTFDSDGFAVTTVGSGNDYIWSVLIQPDGKIAVTGQTHNGSNYDFAVARYSSAGALDTTFDTDGKTSTAIGSGDDYNYFGKLDADGKIVAAGHSSNGTNDDFALVRYNTDGSLDTSATIFSGGTCLSNEKVCYPGVTCTLSNNASGTDANATATCDFTVWFNANYSSGWKLHVNPADQLGTVTTLTDSGAIAVDSLSAISVSETSIAYGSLYVGDSSATGIQTTLQNAGNQALDVFVSGTDMTSGVNTIPRAQQKFHHFNPSFTWGTDDYALVASPSSGTETNGCLNRDLAVRATHNYTTEDEIIWWKLTIPASTASGTYAGSTTFAATTNSSCSGTLY